MTASTAATPAPAARSAARPEAGRSTVSASMPTCPLLGTAANRRSAKRRGCTRAMSSIVASGAGRRSSRCELQARERLQHRPQARLAIRDDSRRDHGRGRPGGCRAASSSRSLDQTVVRRECRTKRRPAEPGVPPRDARSLAVRRGCAKVRAAPPVVRGRSAMTIADNLDPGRRWRCRRARRGRCRRCNFCGRAAQFAGRLRPELFDELIVERRLSRTTFVHRQRSRRHSPRVARQSRKLPEAGGAPAASSSSIRAPECLRPRATYGCVTAACSGRFLTTGRSGPTRRF